MAEDKLAKPSLVDPIQDRDSLEKDHEIKRGETGPSVRRGLNETPARKPLFGR